MKLIDADKLEPDTEWDKYEDGFVSYSKAQIDNAPAVDAVPVVRCKDCTYHSGGFALDNLWCHKFDEMVDMYWFCPMGRNEEG